LTINLGVSATKSEKTKIRVFANEWHFHHNEFRNTLQTGWSLIGALMEATTLLHPSHHTATAPS
jgi:hypothetical protein